MADGTVNDVVGMLAATLGGDADAARGLADLMDDHSQLEAAKWLRHPAVWLLRQDRSSYIFRVFWTEAKAWEMAAREDLQEVVSQLAGDGAAQEDRDAVAEAQRLAADGRWQEVTRVLQPRFAGTWVVRRLPLE